MRILSYLPEWETCVISHPEDMNRGIFAAIVTKDGQIALCRKRYSVQLHRPSYQIFLIPPEGGFATLEEAMEAREREMAKNRLPKLLKRFRITDWQDAVSGGW